MILYDKKSNFLGMSQTELSMLGYEDMVEFKSYHNDFADLFIQKPGYIFKFKNFSWIDYSLHSGAPNKNVILKHKNGKEIETKLHIFEIFLSEEINDSQILYGVEIVNDTVHKFESKETQNNQAEDLTPSTVKTEPKVTTTDIQQSDFLEQEQFIVDNDFNKEDKQENDLYLSTTHKSDIFKEEMEESFEMPDVNDEFILDTNDKEMDIKLKIDNSQNFTRQTTDIQSSSLSNEVLPIEENQTEDFSDFEIDFTKIADETGLELNTIATILEDFILESKEAIIKIKHYDTLEEKVNEILRLKGISQSLKIDRLSLTLNTILNKIKNGEEISDDLNRYITNIRQLEELIS